MIAVPVQAKKTRDKDSADAGGLYHPPAAVPKPSLILDNTPPKAAEVKATNAKAAAAQLAGGPQPAAQPAVPPEASVHSFTIGDLRVHSLFE